MNAWRTRLDPGLTAAFGEPELHAVFFEHKDDRGRRRYAVTVQIPETPAAAFAQVMDVARVMKTRVLFLCDTREQAEDAVARARALLPHHRRVAYERAEAGAWGAVGR